jgi:hypothetical protein
VVVNVVVYRTLGTDMILVYGAEALMIPSHRRDRLVKAGKRSQAKNRQAKPRLLDGNRGQVNLSDVRL